MSALGRLALAEHLRKLSLGFLSRRDPGDLSSMLITDFMLAETGISHHLPQLMGAVVMPVLAFVSLVWIDWRMAVSMFAALPLALLVLWASTSAQKKLSGRQIQAKINAGNRLEEYLQGIRVMKAYNLLGDRSQDISEKYGIHSLPTKILIDREGIIVGRYGGGGESHEKMDEKLKEVFGN